MIHTVNVRTKKGCHSASPNPCVYLVESYCSMAAILFSAEYVYFQALCQLLGFRFSHMLKLSNIILWIVVMYVYINSAVAEMWECGLVEDLSTFPHHFMIEQQWCFYTRSSEGFSFGISQSFYIRKHCASGL